MTFPARTHVLRYYKNEIWEGIVLSEFRTKDGHIRIVCEALGKEFKLFISDPSHLEIKNVNKSSILP